MSSRRTESPEIDPHVSYMVSWFRQRCGGSSAVGRKVLSVNAAGATGQPSGQKWTSAITQKLTQKGSQAQCKIKNSKTSTRKQRRKS